MKKRLLCLLLCVVALCPLLAACSDFYDYNSYSEYITLGSTDKFEVNQTVINNEVLMEFYGLYSDDKLTSTELKEGTVKLGDTVNIDYNGYLFGETEVFEGGTTYENGTPKGTDLEIGSRNYIEGFETGLIGYEVGDTVYLNLYFPDDYSSTELAGKQVRFEVKINKISKRFPYPEMTDENVKTQTDGEYTTVAEFAAEVTENTKKNDVWTKYVNSTKVKTYPEKELEEYYYNLIDQHKSYAVGWYGGDMDTYAKQMGYSGKDALYQNLLSQAKSSVKQDLIILATVKEAKLEISKDEMDKKLRELYEEQKALESNPYEGSFGSFKRDYGQNALEIEIYTDIVMDHLLKTASVIDNTKYTGFKASEKTGVSYYKDDALQTGWLKLDIDRNGTEESFFFDANGKAFEHKAQYVTSEADANVKKLYKFGRFGMLDKMVDGTVESDGTGLMYAINGDIQKGFVEIELNGKYEGKETYYFDENGYMALGVKELPVGNTNAGKFYNFAETGIYNLDSAGNVKVADMSGIDAGNGIAEGIIDDKFYSAGDNLTGWQTVDENNYYFDPADNGKMIKDKQNHQIGDKFYNFDTNGVASEVVPDATPDPEPTPDPAE